MINNILRKIKKHAVDILIPQGFYMRQLGFCPCCDQKVEFISTNSWLRDNFICSNCQSIPRERALMFIIERYYPNWRNQVIHESSPINRGASVKLKLQNPSYQSSHYLPNHPLGITIDDFRNENLEKLTLQDESIDLFITQDVMEHVYNPSKAFYEIARVLKKGGAHIFTVPLINKHNKTEIWALQGNDNNILFLKTPEYHSNPVDPKGSPVTMHWGFDIVEFIRSTSRLETIIEHLDNLSLGIRAEYIEVLISKKI